MSSRKLSPTDEKNIVEEITKNHISQTELAQRYGLKQATISYAFQRVMGETLSEFREHQTKEEVPETELIKRFIDGVLGKGQYKLLSAVAEETEMPLGNVGRVLMAYRKAKKKMRRG